MRERLIGAVVLVIAAVILVPWLVSRAHHPDDIVTHKSWPGSSGTVQQPYVLPLPATRSVAGDATHPSADKAAVMPHAMGTGSAAPRQLAAKSGNGQTASAHQSEVHVPAAGQSVIGKGWNIQAASFADVGAARSLAAKLRQAGFHAGLSSHQVKGKTYYEVRVGPYGSEKLARDAAPGVARISNTKVLVRAPGSDSG